MVANDDYRHVGLTDEQAEESRRRHGANLLTPPERPSVWKLYGEKFNDPVIRILLLAALLSLLISFMENEYAETVGIILAILLATGIGFLFEYDAGRKFDLLNAVDEETAVKVLRGGHIREIPRREVVRGDIVVLDTGDEVPADGELLEAVSLQVNESCLTGEPVVTKTTREADFDPEATYASNRLLRGTTVMDGHAVMRADAVGDATEIGKVARRSTERSEQATPLDIQLTRLAGLIGKAGFGVAAVAFVAFFVKDVLPVYDFSTFRTLRDWLPALQSTLQYFMMAVTLIVVAVPEGLPMSVTLSLALNMRRMLSTHNLVRRMHACETMGAVTVICTDKTGTLTQNRMQVEEFDYRSADPALLAESISANTTAYLEETSSSEPKGVGNPTEAALLLWLRKQGYDYLKLREAAAVIDRLTFSTERKFMATLVRSPLTGKRMLYVKGAPEIILDKCSDGNRFSREEIEETLSKYQQKAMRTLGFAYKTVETDVTDCAALTDEGGLTFLGVAAVSDPVRPDVPAAVARCRAAGIEVKIVTGDTTGTATEIARRIGLWTSEDTERNRITGADFAALTDEEALERVGGLKIMSRARPADKQRLVRLLQRRGAVVAVTGDGTNDAPALNHAQVGLAMGSGTAVAKEAGDITLLDDSFRSIGTAVMWGRSLYKNIQRFILFQLTINFTALSVVLVGSLAGTALPLTVTQMLWVNLIMDTFAALALSSLPPSESVMDEPPRRSDRFIITRPMACDLFGTGLLFSGILLGLLHYFTTGDGTPLTVRELTIFFTVFVMLQLWNLLNARAFGTVESAFKGLSRSYGMLLVIAAILGGQILIVQQGGALFRTVPLDLATWVVLIASTSVVLWIGEAVRLIRRTFLLSN